MQCVDLKLEKSEQRKEVALSIREIPHDIS